MSLRYVIDGYNVINHSKLRDKIGKAQDCRLALLELIRLDKLCGSPRNEVVVVFDGWPPPSTLNYAYPNFKVIFSKDICADRRIKDILEASGGLKNTVVVSNDKEIVFYARSCRAKTENVEEFLSRSASLTAKPLGAAPLTYAQIRDINEELRKRWGLP